MKAIIDIHSHTYASGHAFSTLNENIESAIEKGVKVLATTDHAPEMPGGAHIYHFWNQRAIPEVIKGVRVLKGVEANIINRDGGIDVPEELLDELEFCIASFHPPCFKSGTMTENTDTLLKVMSNCNINVIGHPGDSRYPFDVKTIIDASVKTHTALEMNNASLAPFGFREGGDKVIRNILDECGVQNCPVVMGSDAHYCSHIGNFEYVEKLFNEIAFPTELVLNYDVDRFFEYFGIE